MSQGLPGPERALGRESSGETNALTQQKPIGKGPWGEEQPGKGTRGNCSAAWLAVSGFKVRS